MNFYIAKIVFRIDVLNYMVERQYEEKIILLKAADIKKAYNKAIASARKEEAEFVNANGHLIKWGLEGITHLSKLVNIDEETELFSELKDSYSEYETHILKRRIDGMAEKFISI